MNKKVIAILAIDEEFWIWKNNDIPWKSDLKNFKEITTQTNDENKQNVLIMWRNTWESIPEKFRPFKWRINIVISRNSMISEWINHSTSVEEAIEYAKNNDSIENIFIIWWAQIYNYSFEKDLIDEIYLTKITGKHDCDTFVKMYLEKFREYFKSNVIVWEEIYEFIKYKK